MTDRGPNAADYEEIFSISTSDEIILFASRSKVFRCRCLLRHMTDEERQRYGCPGIVEGVGEMMGECQEDAKRTAPIQCRAHYGHCKRTYERR
jgi:hypothetical protein